MLSLASQGRSMGLGGRLGALAPAAEFLRSFLALGLLARASVGPAERLLNMVGEQRVCAYVYAGAFSFNLVGCLMLIPHFGMMGAAFSTSTALIFESLALFLVTRHRLGLHVFIVGRTPALRAAESGV